MTSGSTRIVAIKTLRADLASGPTPSRRGSAARRRTRALAQPSGDRGGLRHRRGHWLTGEPRAVHRHGVRRRPHAAGPAAVEGRRLLPERALEIIAGVLRRAGVSATRHGIVHRDIKPGNVMLTQHRRRSRSWTSASPGRWPTAQATMTADGRGDRHRAVPVAGAGPRRAGRTPAATSTPTGCLLYELLTGRAARSPATSPVAMAYQHVREDPVPPSEVNPDVHRGWTRSCCKALAKYPADRYQTAGEMREPTLQRAAPACRWRRHRRPGSPMYRRPSGWGPGAMAGGDVGRSRRSRTTTTRAGTTIYAGPGRWRRRAAAAAGSRGARPGAGARCRGRRGLLSAGKQRQDVRGTAGEQRSRWPAAR